MDTIFLRKEYNITQLELSQFFGIPLATIKNWDTRHCMPEYISNILIDYLTAIEDFHYQYELRKEFNMLYFMPK